MSDQVPIHTRHKVFDISRFKYDQLLRTDRLPERHASLPQPVPDSWWLHLSRVPRGVHHPFVEHGQIW